ncbi:MAG: VacB/RNase II family 3'-5' exoribonuclease [Cellvibrionales bacterium]|nr:VacB/RNase II family 3'-5' exoribonuclease [Cellvibrionales bacterium]
MLDLSALSQLKQLKQEIREANPTLKGMVKGTSKRFGFVIKEGSNEQYLLPQSEMDRLLHGDFITFKLEKSQKQDDKPIAKIEKFISSSLDTFIGLVKVKNNQMFVIPEHKQINRWIFIPPKFRKELRDGDIVQAKISQHPYKTDGRVQAQIIEKIGQPSDPYIEHRYSIVKFGIPARHWKNDEIEAIRQTAEQCLEEAISSKADMRDKCFVTIDGTNTQDLDDALWVEQTDDGWQLDVAIADVSTFITQDSPLDKIAAKQGHSVYLPGQKVPMLPDILASDVCSLRSNVDRLALVCQMTLDNEGNIIKTTYTDAVIHSKGKLGYDEVNRYLLKESDGFSDEINQLLDQLKAVSDLRLKWRETHAAMTDEYYDYRYQMDDTGKIINIEKNERNQAQKLVEECMIACNAATASYLSSQTDHALFLAHDGFKLDQKPGIKKLINSEFEGTEAEQLFDLTGYLAFLKQPEVKASALPVKDILRKKMKRSEWSATVAPHFGLGLNSYTTFTSPIRKYSDLLVHRLIKTLMSGQTPLALSAETLENLNQTTLATREAQKDCETALKCDYLKGFVGKPLQGEIASINHRFLGIFLSDFDLLGQIPVKTLGKASKFKQESLQLVTDSHTYRLKEPVTVYIHSIDKNERLIRLSFENHAAKNEQESTSDQAG